MALSALIVKFSDLRKRSRADACATGRDTSQNRVNGGASPGPPRRAAARDRRAPARRQQFQPAAHCPTSHSHACEGVSNRLLSRAGRPDRPVNPTG